MNDDEMIGRLYRSLVQAEERFSAVVGIVAAIKDGTLDLARVEVSETGINVAAVTDEA